MVRGAAALKHVLAEIAGRYQQPRKRQGAPPRIADYLATLFEQQRALLECPAKFVAARTTRRAGKSSAVPALLLDAGHHFPGTVVYYIHPDGGTRAEETLLGPDINIEAICERYSLGWRYNANKRTLRNLETGTEIRIRGADDAREARKFRGDKVSRVVLDEAQNYPSALMRRLVEEDVGPALADVRGQLYAVGTPGDVCHPSNYWYAITRNESPDSEAKRLPEWEVFGWSALDNPHVRENIAETVAEKLAAYLKGQGYSAQLLRRMLLEPEGRRTVEALASMAAPGLLREWFGRWVPDVGGRFYRFDEKRNVYDGCLPAGHVWQYVLGVDLGTGDAFAYVVFAVSRTCKTIFEVESFSRTGLHAEEWRERTQEVAERWQVVRAVVDEGGLGHGVVKGWRERHSMAVDPAEKTEKLAHVALMNAELEEGRVQVLTGGEVDRSCGALATEWAALRKREAKDGKPAEPAGPDHVSDAGLYAWREAWRLSAHQDEPAPAPGTAEAHRLMVRRQQESWLRQQREREEMDTW